MIYVSHMGSSWGEHPSVCSAGLSPIGSDTALHFTKTLVLRDSTEAEAVETFKGGSSWLLRYRKAEVLRTKHSALATVYLLTVCVP